LRYVLLSVTAKHLIDSRLNTTVQKTLNLKDIRSLPIPIAPQTERDAIVETASALENKINLNHQINQTLEQMAQAIFKSWFVNFEPVKAKIAALKAGGSDEDALLAAMQAISGKGETELTRLQAEQPEQYAELRATAELFPSAMQDSELGEIPEGWSVPSFEDITVAKQGKYLAKDKMSPTISPDSNVPVWGGNGILGYTKSCSYPAPVILMTCRGSNCGLIRHTESEAWVSNNAFACSPRIGSVWFLLTYFNASSFDDCISGSAQPQITYSALRSKRLAIPIHEETCKRYSALIQAMFDQIIHLRNEALSLENLRDALLPKLLTGELKV
jgi:type I restriction enzyme S subunit